jgi:hypothetical protein
MSPIIIIYVYCIHVKGFIDIFMTSIRKSLYVCWFFDKIMLT